jgi:sec-independent protein translocase protein TatC
MTKLPGALVGARIVGERFVHSRRQQNPTGAMPLVHHLRELRNRIVKMALALATGMAIGFAFFRQAWHFIEHPLCSAVIRGHSGCHTLGANQLVLDGPLDSFYLRVKVAFIVGIVLSSPIWLYQVWAFVAPGLYTREKRWSYIFVATAVPLFLTGATLAYWSLSRSMHYLLGLAPGGISNLIQVDSYMSFVITMVLAFGLAFELPLVIILMNLTGIMTHARFAKWRRLILFTVFLVAGVASPSPDPVTMLILGGACAALVEVAELIVWANDRRRARLHPGSYAGLADDELSPIDLDDAGTRDSILS